MFIISIFFFFNWISPFITLACFFSSFIKSFEILFIGNFEIIRSTKSFYHDTDSERWAVAKQIAASALAITPDQFMVTVTLNTSAPTESDGQYGVGEMWVETDTQDIFIRTN